MTALRFATWMLVSVSLAVNACGARSGLLDAYTDANASGSSPCVAACATLPCQPVDLAEGPAGLFAIATDGQYAYFGNTQTGTVSRSLLCGGAQTIIASNQTDPLGVAVDDAYVYWVVGTLAGSVARAPKQGGASETLASFAGQPTGIAVDESFAYVTVAASSDLGVWKLSKAGGATSQLYAGDVARPIALDDDAVYFSEDFAGMLTRVPKTGGPALALAPSSTQSQIALDAERAFVVGGEAGLTAIESVPKLVGGPTLLAVLPGEPIVGLAVQGSFVYWTDQTLGQLGRVPIAGGSAQMIASGQATIEQLAARDEWLVWANYGDGTVRGLRMAP